MGKWQTWRPYTIATHVTDELVTTLQEMGKWQTGLSLLQFLPIYINLSIESNKTQNSNQRNFTDDSTLHACLYCLGYDILCCNITFTFWFCHSHWLKFWALQLLLYHLPTVLNSPNLHLSCYMFVCVCVCVYKYINLATMEWKNQKRFLPTSGIYFRKFFPCLIAWIFPLRYWPFKIHKNSLPEADK